MADFAEIARDLLSLEVNTVVKDGMSAQKMPTPTNALIDTMQAYHRMCVKAAMPFGVPGTPLSGWASRLSQTFSYGRQPYPQLPDGPRSKPECVELELLNDEPTALREGDIGRLREVALWLSHMRLRTLALHDKRAVDPVAELVNPEPGEDSAAALRRLRVDPATLDAAELASVAEAAKALERIDGGTLNRMRHNCDQLRGVRSDMGEGKPLNELALERNSPLVLSTDALVLLRKIWDVGTETVLLQTVIHIDGDVVNRIATELLDRPRPGVQESHRAAVDVSFRQWTYLVDTLARWAGQSVQALLGR